MAPARRAEAERSSLMTVGAIAIVAYAACDMTHEVLGHGTAILFTPGVRPALLTTVALSSYGSSRLIAAAGTAANLAAGFGALWFLRGKRGSAAVRYFAWLFAALNLFNATGYFAYSGITDFGDWQAVTAGLHPHAAWRIALIVVGLASYAWVAYFAATLLRQLVSRGDIPSGDVPRVLIASYLVGGLLLAAGAAMNPVDPRLVFLSGISGGFGAMAGLLWVAGQTGGSTSAPSDACAALRFSGCWIGSALLVALVFVFVIGRGIRL